MSTEEQKHISDKLDHAIALVMPIAEGWFGGEPCSCCARALELMSALKEYVRDRR